uniref:Uncharacterized protein n=1 Tax=Salix viminalis TaxID=40686 RepID=A0A6N2MHD5_SALVM
MHQDPQLTAAQSSAFARDGRKSEETVHANRHQNMNRNCSLALLNYQMDADSRKANSNSIEVDRAASGHRRTDRFSCDTVGSFSLQFTLARFLKSAKE